MLPVNMVLEIETNFARTRNVHIIRFKSFRDLTCECIPKIIQDDRRLTQLAN